MKSNRYIFIILKVQSWPDRHSKAAPAPKSSIGESANSESIIAILLDPCSEYSLIQNGILPYGADIRAELCLPSYTALRQAVINHYDTIRNYALNTSGSVYACGWLLDIARGIYTLRTGSVIAKTKAGVWALKQRLCPVEHDLKTALTVRNNPLRYKNDPDIREWAAALGPSIQRFADVLEAEIQQTAQPVDHAMGNKIHH